MKKVIEQFKMKKLAKTIAGVTLGAVALGTMSMTPVYAAEGKLNGGSEESGVYAGTSAVTISGASTGTELVNSMAIYGNATGSSVTGSVTAANFDSSGVTGLQIWGGYGYSTIDGVTGLKNKVLWDSSAKVGNIKTITGFEASANGVSATDTTVTLNGATVADDGKVYGAQVKSTSGNATVTGTTVTLTDTKANNPEWHGFAVYGAYVESSSGTATAKGTQVTLNKTGIGFGKDVCGAYVTSGSGTATATGTTLTLTDTTTGGNSNIWGAKVEGKTSATAIDTKVIMTGGSVKVDKFNGVELTVNDNATGVAEATGTTLTINGATLDCKVQGALVNGKKSGKASDTKITITGGELKEYLNAAEVKANEEGSIGQANNTTLIINGTKIRTTAAHIQGAEVSANAGGEIMSATGTTVKLNLHADSDMGNLTGVMVGGDAGAPEAAASATADTTEVEMTGGKVQNVVGAKFYKTNAAEAKVTTVTLNKVEEAGTVIGVNFTENETTPSPIAETAKANDTTVTVTGTKVSGAIKGVNVAAVKSGFEAKTVTANNTKLTINGTTVDGDVTGVSAKATNTITATNTQVIFEGAASTVKGTVYGVDLSGATSITSSGTALTIKNTGNSAGNIAGFDTINFYIPDSINPNDAMLKLTKAEVTDLTNTTITAPRAVDATNVNLNDGDKIYLINKTGTGDLKLKDGIVGKEVLLVEDAVTTKKGTYALDDNDLLLKISKGGEKPQDVVDNEKSLTETLAASVALLNSGADFATEQALSQAKAVAREGVKEGVREMMPFAAFGGSSMKYKSGSHIDAKGRNAALGFAKEQGELTYGIAVEHGQADFDSYVNAAHGEGKNKYTGGVIFAELKKKSGVHFDASFRAGRAENDYNANLSVLGISKPTSYDVSATYLGFSLGSGKEMKVSETGTIDLYGRYYFNHLNGANAKTNSGIDIDFKDSDSSRLRLGTRYTQEIDEYNKLYAGLAWQYEFAGKAKAVVNGTDAPSPSLKGHSAMLELGIKTKAGKNLDIDLGLNGWGGKQRGIGGNIGFKWIF